jgi:hypothetical protein
MEPKQVRAYDGKWQAQGKIEPDAEHRQDQGDDRIGGSCDEIPPPFGYGITAFPSAGSSLVRRRSRALVISSIAPAARNAMDAVTFKEDIVPVGNSIGMPGDQQHRSKHRSGLADHPYVAYVRAQQ